MSSLTIIARYVLMEAVRRRTFAVVTVITVILLGLYAWGAWVAFDAVSDVVDLRGFSLDGRTFVGNQLTGVTVFGEMFLGAVLAVLLSQGAIRGDAESGILQPLVARPVGRTACLATRFLVVGAVVAAFVMLTHITVSTITGLAGNWWPPDVAAGAFHLAGALFVVTAITVAASVFLGVTANGIAVFLLFGGGMAAGMLIDVAGVTGSGGLQAAARTVTWLLPFEQLYQSAIAASSVQDADQYQLLTLGPFSGGRPAHPLLVPWTIAYCGILLAAAATAFGRRDL